MTPTDLARRLDVGRYPRSSRYDPAWLVENMMGPNPLWLMEHLTDRFTLEAGQRVMDLGCGTGLTSIFLAREFDVRVHAVDLWISADENWPRIREAGESARVVPIRANANKLPFAEGYFDAIVSVDAYHYFGTPPEYLATIVRYLAPGGVLAIACPGLAREITSVPESLAPFWESGFELFHSAEWWRALWQGSGHVTIDHADMVEHGAADWLRWAEATDDWKRANGREPFVREAEMLRADSEHLLGFVAVIARRHQPDRAAQRGIAGGEHDDG
jgi:cyclopropane fatty-acyl-phospholipid synthase-like methyltransferase